MHRQTDLFGKALLLVALSLAPGCAGTERKGQHDTVDASCGCDADCDNEPDGGISEDQAEEIPWDGGPTAPENDPAAALLAPPRAPNQSAPLCIGNMVNPKGPCLGMCGPRCSGKYCTVECLDHDCCVRKKICAGMSAWKAHCLCLRELVPAITSLLQCFQNPGDSCMCDANGAYPNASCP